MPIIKSAKKAARQTEKRTANNQRIKKSIKTALKTFKADPTAKNLSKVQSEYDKAVKKGLLKKNTASRRKAALVKFAKKANGVETAVKTAEKKAAKTVKSVETKAKKTLKDAETKAEKTAKDLEKKAKKVAKALES